MTIGSEFKRLASVLVFGMLCLLIVSGCGTSGPKFPTVKGSVTLDGKPLPKGTIRFVGTDASAASQDAISDGKYSAKVPPGTKTVEISTAEPQVEGSETIPAKYNTATELKATIEDKNTELNFDLKTS